MRRRLFKFIAVRSGIFCLIAILLSPLFLAPIFYILGVILGYSISVLRFNILSTQLADCFITHDSFFSRKKRSFMYIFSFLLPIFVLLLAYLHSKQIFIGCTIGIISIPISLSIYSFTEAIGLTSTNFEAGDK